MIGVVVVTHGQLATELVNAAETIVGDLPQFAAVSIGWHDDVELAREEIAQAVARVDSGSGVHRAHRHVRRHAVEPRNHVSRRGTCRSRHRREPADAAEAGGHARGGGSPRDWRATSAKTGAPASGSPPTCCAARGAPEMVSRDVTITNALGMHARAAARFVHAATAFQAQVRVTARQPRDRRQEHHGHPAARRRARHRADDHGRRARRAEALETLCTLIEAGFGENAMQRLKGVAVTDGPRRAAPCCSRTAARPCGSRSRPSRWSARSSACSSPAIARACSSRESRRASATARDRISRRCSTRSS